MSDIRKFVIRDKVFQPGHSVVPETAWVFRADRPRPREGMADEDHSITILMSPAEFRRRGHPGEIDVDLSPNTPDQQKGAPDA